MNRQAILSVTVAIAIIAGSSEIAKAQGLTGLSAGNMKAFSMVVANAYRFFPQMPIREPGYGGGGGSGIGPTEQAEIDRCARAAQQYRPTYETDLKDELRLPYIDACFRRLSVLPSAMQASLRRSIGTLVGSAGQRCSVLLIGPRKAATARHCFLSQGVRVDVPIREEVLERATVEGLNANGTPWSVRGLKLVADPLGEPASFRTALDTRQAWGMNARDFVVVAPPDSQTFPVDATQPFTLQSDARPPTVGQRLLVASFIWTDIGILVDNFPTCRLISYHGSSGYLKHRCQALPGSSGAPVFITTEDGRPTAVVGLHVGPEGYVSKTRPPAYDNEAVVVARELIVQLDMLAKR